MDLSILPEADGVMEVNYKSEPSSCSCHNGNLSLGPNI